MTVHVVGAYIRDSFMYCHALPREGESVAAHTLADSDGGKGANQAIMAARLEAPTRFIGSVGKDAIGDHAVALFRGEGVCTDGVVRAPGTATGRSSILVDDDAHQCVVTWSGAADALTSSDVDRALAGLQRGEVLSIQGEIPLAVSLHAAHLAAPQAIVICNPSPVEQFRAHPDPWADIDVLIVNDVEAQDLLGVGRSRPRVAPEDTVAALSTRFRVPSVVVTHGADGATLFDGGSLIHLAARKTVAVDPTGAGDAFAGALAAELSNGESLYEACRTAISAASHSVTRRFCVPSYPTRGQLGSEESESAAPSPPGRAADRADTPHARKSRRMLK